MEELVKRLREAPNDWPDADLHYEAADAIGELSKDLERSKEWETFWEKEANEALKKFQTIVDRMPRWIPVTERLPEEDGEYLVCGRWRGKQTEIWVCEFMTLGYLKGWANNAANPVVSYWMPLPEPPKEKT